MKFIGANRFEEFVSGYGIWIIIGCLGVAFIISVIFLFLNISKVKRAKLANSEEKQNVIKSTVDSSSDEENVKTKETKQPKIESDYNISYDKEKDDWVVKKIGAKRASKRCKTKEEALEAVKNFNKEK